MSVRANTVHVRRRQRESEGIHFLSLNHHLEKSFTKFHSDTFNLQTH